MSVILCRRVINVREGHVIGRRSKRSSGCFDRSVTCMCLVFIRDWGKCFQ